jgi:hypothetical protein
MPALPIHVHGLDGQEIHVLGLVDSGADCTCFPIVFAELLGIDLSACTMRRGSTAGGAHEQFRWEPGLQADVAGETLTLSAVFTASPIALLGRQDFFRVFEVQFDERQSVFMLTRFDDPETEQGEDVVALPVEAR